MPSSTAPSPHDFTLEYRSDTGILIGRWLRALDLAGIQGTYEAMLAAAQAHGNCRRWLLDIRRRPAGDPQNTIWFREQYMPRLVPTLGGPVALAYFAMIDHTAATNIQGILANVERGQQENHQVRYFNQEGEALTWLHQQPGS